jgi:hypothetical protein
LDAIEQVASGISPEDVNMSNSLCGIAFSECKVMDKSTNLLTIPFFTADHSSALQLFKSFTTVAYIQNLPLSYASTEFRMHYKLGVFSFT